MLIFLLSVFECMKINETRLCSKLEECMKITETKKMTILPVTCLYIGLKLSENKRYSSD